MVTAVVGAGATFHDVRWFDEVDSTNRVALDLARAGAADGVVVVADHQTAGRGRLGRTWVAPPGASLLMSALLRPGLAPDRRHLLTMAMALAAREACADVGPVRPELKWPNDLIVGDRKLGGILAEADGDAVVVGLGVNVNWPKELPSEVAGVAIALNHLDGAAIDRRALLDRVLRRFEARSADLGTVVLDYPPACSTLGRRVRVLLPDGELVGQAFALTETGHLMVEDDERRVHRVAAGDIVHLRPR